MTGYAKVGDRSLDLGKPDSLARIAPALVCDSVVGDTAPALLGHGHHLARATSLPRVQRLGGW